MRNGLIGRMAIMVALAIPVGACSSSGTSSPGGSPGSAGASGGTGGNSSSTGGNSSGTGGNSSGTGGNSSGTGGSGGGGPAEVTSLAGNKAFKDLKDAELTQLCNDTFAYFESSISRADRCKWAGLQMASSSSPESDAIMQTTCTTYRDLCNTTDGGTGSNSDCFGWIDPLCEATVAQYSTCISDETAGFSSTVNGFPACSAIKISNIRSIMEAKLATAPSCEAFMNACSGLDVPNPLTL